MKLGMNELESLLSASPLLDQVEDTLRKKVRNVAMADKLNKLQQDAGIAFQQSFSTLDPTAGPRTARLVKDYQEVTVERFSTTLLDSHTALQEGDLKRTFGMLLKTMIISKPPAQAVTRPPTAMKH